MYEEECNGDDEYRIMSRRTMRPVENNNGKACGKYDFLFVGGGNLGELIYERQRHCRQHALTAALPPTCIHSGIAASMHSHSGIAASMQRHCRHAALPPVCSGTAAMQRALTAALPPACVHSGIAASMHSLRHCRQQALTPLNLNSCCHFGSSVST